MLESLKDEIIRTILHSIKQQRLEDRKQMETMRDQIAALDRKADQRWEKLESMLKGRVTFAPSEPQQVEVESEQRAPLAPEERSRVAMVATKDTMKRSFLSRFLEEEDDEPAPKDGAERLLVARFKVLQHFFGICDADPKLGREASSLIHPQSPFATGMRPAAPRAPRVPPRRLLGARRLARNLQEMCGCGMRSRPPHACALSRPPSLSRSLFFPPLNPLPPPATPFPPLERRDPAVAH